MKSQKQKNKEKNNVIKLEELKVEILRLKHSENPEDLISLLKIIIQICDIRKRIGTNNGEKLRELEVTIENLIKTSENPIKYNQEIQIAIDFYIEELNNFINITRRVEESFPYKHPILVILFSIIITIIAIFCLYDQYEGIL